MHFRPNFDLLSDWQNVKKSKDFASNSAYFAILNEITRHWFICVIYTC